jgi:hypothetical protein
LAAPVGVGVILNTVMDLGAPLHQVADAAILRLPVQYRDTVQVSFRGTRNLVVFRSRVRLSRRGARARFDLFVMSE